MEERKYHRSKVVSRPYPNAGMDSAKMGESGFVGFLEGGTAQEPEIKGWKWGFLVGDMWARITEYIQNQRKEE